MDRAEAIELLQAGKEGVAKWNATPWRDRDVDLSHANLADADLEGRARKARQHRADADSEEEHDHHSPPAPAVREPTRRQREGAEGDESGGRVDDELRVGHVERRRQHQGRHRGRRAADVPAG